MEAEFEAVGDADETEGGEDRIGEEVIEKPNRRRNRPQFGRESTPVRPNFAKGLAVRRLFATIGAWLLHGGKRKSSTSSPTSRRRTATRPLVRGDRARTGPHLAGDRSQTCDQPAEQGAVQAPRTTAAGRSTVLPPRSSKKGLRPPAAADLIAAGKPIEAIQMAGSISLGDIIGNCAGLRVGGAWRLYAR